MSWQRLWAILRARNMEFFRDRSALGWNFMFPILIVAGFGFAFSGEPAKLYKVGVYNKDNTASSLAFFKTDYIQFITVTDLAPAIIKVDRHQLDMLLDVTKNKFWINESSPKGYILERVLRGADIKHTQFDKATVTGREIRYVDWVLPGVLAMNMMFSALFGIGYVIVRYRKNGVLKRLKATPLTAFEFLAAQIISRSWLIMLILVLVYVGTNYFIGFTMHGSYVDLFLVFLLGAVSLISMGLLIAARVKSEELAGGLLNLITWPMMFLSGVWFSTEGIHPVLQKVALFFPLTHVLSAARAIMIDGSGLQDIGIQMIALLIMSGVFLVIGALSFRWE